MKNVLSVQLDNLKMHVQIQVMVDLAHLALIIFLLEKFILKLIVVIHQHVHRSQIPKFDSAQNQNPTRCVDCSEGTYEVDGTCIDCPVNKYNLNKGQTSCLDCNTCSPGEKNYECGGANIGQCSPCTKTLTSNQIYKPFGELSNKHDTCLTNTCSYW